MRPHSYNKPILIEGNDPRGIDMAILSRFPMIRRPILHTISFQSNKKTTLKRGILEVWFQGKHNIIRTFAVHFPAPYHRRNKRLQAFHKLKELKESPTPENTITIAAGDFNVTSKEDSFMYRYVAGSDWSISHLKGCHSCLGTYYYRRNRSWSFLDAILLAHNKRCQFVDHSIKTGSPSLGSDHLPLYAEVSCASSYQRERPTPMRKP